MSGEIINGYRLQKTLATGQTSQVWEVVEVSSSRHFAMKILLPEFAKLSEHRKFLFHEASVGKELSHPNVIKIIRVTQSETNPNFVMEYFTAGSLKSRIQHKAEDFLREFGIEIVKKWATALAYMNASGWVHRDVKPDNLLVSSAGDVRLIDFAISQKIPKGLFAKLFFLKRKAQGTRSYMSPEQIRSQRLDGRADIYSFGASCYEMIAGRPPFRGTSDQDLLVRHITEKPLTPKTHNPAVSDEFAALILRMLEKKREDRPRDFHEVLMALRTMKIYRD